MDAWSAVLMVGFAARLTRLAVVDDLLEPFRVWAVLSAHRRARRAGAWVGSLLSCPFCIGFWLSAGVAASWWAVGHTAAWTVVAAVFSLSYVVGHLVRVLDMGGDDG